MITRSNRNGIWLLRSLAVDLKNQGLELEEIEEILLSMASAWDVEPDAARKAISDFGHRNPKPLVGQRASDVRPRKVKWLWRDDVPRGKLTILDGDPDKGKSLITTDLAAARVSAGRSFPDGANCLAAPVILANL